MPPWDGAELTHQLRVHSPVAHPFQNRHTDPGVGHQLDQRFILAARLASFFSADDLGIEFVELLRHGIGMLWVAEQCGLLLV